MKDLVDDLGETGIVLNSAAPMKCSMGTPCEDDEYTFWNWQKDMLDEIEAGVRREGLWFMQDKESIDMWNNGIGCGHDDLVVYDRTGRVSDYFPSENTFTKLAESGVAEEVRINGTYHRFSLMIHLTPHPATPPAEEYHIRPAGPAHGRRLREREERSGPR